MKAIYGLRWRVTTAVVYATTALAAAGPTAADPGVAVFPGMEIHQDGAVCEVGFVEPRMRVALTTGQCDGGASVVTDRDGHALGSVVMVRRQVAQDAVLDGAMLPVEYEVIALAPDVAASDVLPDGRRLRSAPGAGAQPGLEVCQWRRTAGRRCGAVGSVGNGRFNVAEVAADARDFGGPFYIPTADDAAVIVGLFEGTCGSAPQLESWQAVMQQLYIDARMPGGPAPAGGFRLVGGHAHAADHWRGFGAAT